MSLARTGMEKLGGLIASGATTLYEKYGQGPVNILKNRFNHIAEGYHFISNSFKKGFWVRTFTLLDCELASV